MPGRELTPLRGDLDGVKGSVEEHWPVLGRPLYYTFGAGERDMGAESKALQQFDPGQLNIADQPVLGGKEDAYGKTL